MNNNDPNFSRINRKRRTSKSNQLLNVLIGLVVLLIIVVGAFIIIGPKDDKDNDLATDQNEEQSSSNSSDSLESDPVDDESIEIVEPDDEETESSTDQNAGLSADDSNDEDAESDSSTSSEGEEESSGTVTIVPSEDDFIQESVINTSWKPIGTEQTGVHESKYDKKSVDWVEKQKALAYATGFGVDELIYWKIKNGGSPQKSIGIVSTKDKSEKFRVFLEWVDGQGWQPVKMDKLTTLDFDY